MIAIFLGLPGAVTMTSVLEAKFVGAAVHQSGLDDDVHLRGVRRSEDVGGRALRQLRRELRGPQKLELTSLPGLSALNLSRIWVNAGLQRRRGEHHDRSGAPR